MQLRIMIEECVFHASQFEFAVGWIGRGFCDAEEAREREREREPVYGGKHADRAPVGCRTSSPVRCLRTPPWRRRESRRFPFADISFLPVLRPRDGRSSGSARHSMQHRGESYRGLFYFNVDGRRRANSVRGKRLWEAKRPREKLLFVTRYYCMQ